MIKHYNTIIVGGGAAGFFTAIQIAEHHPKKKILILEKSPKVLEKVKISGGGRCNVTHACFEPKELVKFYPRGNQELLGPFNTFMCNNMIAWLEKNGVKTKVENDGRVFPVSNSSQTIIDCFLRLCKKYNIEIRTKLGLDSFVFEHNKYSVKANTHTFTSNQIVIATGSNRKLWNILENAGHTIAKPVPSLFTFKIKHALLQELPGLSVSMGKTKIKTRKREETGPILITHKGLSGPGILKISAWEAVYLAEVNYKFTLVVNWINEDYKTLLLHYKNLRENQPKTKFISLNNTYNLPKRLWKKIITLCDLENRNFAEAGNKHLESLAKMLTVCELPVDGKNTNKDEFVTCGGVVLDEVNFKTMESKKLPNLFFAGEVINVDALTGGFNFQNAWTTAFVAAQAICRVGDL
ncbi:MAG: NAD(P)/FAD-dependent oxidoreductase [Chitinophagales bacterium]